LAFLQVPVYHDIQIDMEERMSPDVIRGIREGVASPDICWDAADLGGLQSHRPPCHRGPSVASIAKPGAACARNKRAASIFRHERSQKEDLNPAGGHPRKAFGNSGENTVRHF
jgi:hypothetical protein